MNTTGRVSEFVCSVTLTKGVKTTTVPVVIDSGCMLDIELEQDDATYLELNRSESFEVTLADGVTRTKMYNYESVLVTLTFNNGEKITHSMTPSIQDTPYPESSSSVVGANCTVVNRLLGYEGLRKLGVKLDVKNNKLTRRVIRI